MRIRRRMRSSHFISPSWDPLCTSCYARALTLRIRFNSAHNSRQIQHRCTYRPQSALSAIYREARTPISRTNATTRARARALSRATQMSTLRPARTGSPSPGTSSCLQDHRFLGKRRSSQQLRYRQPKQSIRLLRKPPRKLSGSRTFSKISA